MIDDDPLFRLLVLRVAEELGRATELRFYRSLAEAETAPGRWVLDLNLPDGTGVDWARKLRATGHSDPIWLISHGSLPADIELEALAPCQFARKPQGLEQLKEMMRLWWS